MARARSSASRSAPFRQTQSRSASTMPTRQSTASPQPAPVQAQPYPAVMAQPAPRQPGLFGQMAATAAGVAVGHSIGHTITVRCLYLFLFVRDVLDLVMQLSNHLSPFPCLLCYSPPLAWARRLTNKSLQINSNSSRSNSK
jgi:hypothetical protein